jgi:pimeloyl-ACP methyl ester carboxylesterase
MHTVISKDGTKIAYKINGNGPVVILVDGAFCSKDFGPTPKLVPVLANNFTVISYDRRARGDSSDTQPYSVQREIEDIEALINIGRGTAYLYGVSSGAVLCIEAVASGLPVKKLVIFEPPYFTEARRHEPPPDSERQLNQMIAEGRKKDAVKFYLRKVIGVPAIVPFILRLTPNWSKMIANANSLPYDAAVMGNFKVPKNVLASINIPVMVIASAKSPQSLRKPSQIVAELLPAGTQKILKGQIHNVSPKTLVPELIEFYNN